MFSLYLVQTPFFRLCQIFLTPSPFTAALYFLDDFAGCFQVPFSNFSSPLLQLEQLYFPQPLLTERMLQALNLLQFVSCTGGGKTGQRILDVAHTVLSASAQSISTSLHSAIFTLHFAIQLPFLLCAVTYSYWQSSQD